MKPDIKWLWNVWMFMVITASNYYNCELIYWRLKWQANNDRFIYFHRKLSQIQALHCIPLDYKVTFTWKKQYSLGFLFSFSTNSEWILKITSDLKKINSKPKITETSIGQINYRSSFRHKVLWIDLFVIMNVVRLSIHSNDI